MRPLIGVVVAYSVAAQSLLIALGGFTLPAQADDGTPAFELCLHDGQGAPELPTSNPEHTGCTHCIFGSHHAAIGAPPLVAIACMSKVSKPRRWELMSDFPIFPLTR